MDDYLNINRELWNNRTTHHLPSSFYDVKSFIEGRSSLNRIELDLLGDISGKSILHLQCHFGQDSISFARLGAGVTGMDLSDSAIDTAKELAEKCNADCDFICCDLYSLPENLDKKFDIVFTSYGTIGWLPDLDKWAGVIAHFLKPGGKFVFAEFHPVIWMFDNALETVTYNYFKDEPIIETESGSYAAPDANLNLRSVSWNHSISQVLSALLKRNLILRTFTEYDYSPYNCFGAEMEEFEKNRFRFLRYGNKLPLVYALVAEKTNE